MKLELQKKLVKKYPRIFGEEDSKLSASCSSLCIGDGWYNLVDESSYVETLSGSGYEIYNQDEILNIMTSSVWHKELVV